MKKLIPILFLLVFACASCSDDDNNNPADHGSQDSPYKTGKDLSTTTQVRWENKGIEDKYYMLGYGYDVTGKYAHPASVRNRVIDIDKFAEEDESRINKSWTTSSSPIFQMEGSAEKCRAEMASKVGFSDKETAKYRNLFRDTFISPFKNDTSFTDLEYHYASISQINIVCFMEYIEEHFDMKHLSDEFKSDLQSKTSEEIINIYGTHVLKNIVMGEKINYLYRHTISIDNPGSRWFLFKIHSHFIPGPGMWDDKPEVATPLKENLYVEVVDAMHPKAWMIDITNYTGERIVFEGWNNITDDNQTLVDFRKKNCLVPIYELVDDTQKKEELREAFEKYLTE